MAAAPAARSRSRAKPKASPDAATPADIQRIVADLSSMLLERDVPLRLATYALLANANLHLLGEAGVAKSLLLRELGKRLVHDGGTPAVVFEEAMDEEITKNELLGPIDFPRLSNEGVMGRVSDGYIPTADLVFIDELTRSSQPARNILLPIMNTGERLIRVDGVRQRAPMLCFVSASNHMPDPDDAMSHAFVDRMTLLFVVERIRLDANFTDMIVRAGDRDRQNGSFQRETLNIDSVRAAQKLVSQVKPTPDYLDGLAKLRGEARAEGLGVSDRRWVEITNVCRAVAWMAGRDHLISEDLVAAEFAMARDPEQFAIAHQLTVQFHGRFVQAAAKHREEAAEYIARWQTVRPQVEAVPTDQKLDDPTLKEVMSVRRNLGLVKARVDGVVSEADRDQREAAELRALQAELDTIERWYTDVAGFPAGR